MTPVHAVIIAGGLGERLGGVRKADLRIGGQSLLGRAIAGLGPVDGVLIVAIGPEGAPVPTSLPPIARVVRDLSPERSGPLAGLAAAVAALGARGITSGTLLSAAVDAPCLPADYAGRLLGGLADAPAAFAAWGEDFYPTNAAWRIEALAELPQRVAAGTAPGSLKGLLRELGARQIDWQTPDGDNPFANVNTLADLLALQRRARG